MYTRNPDLKMPDLDLKIPNPYLNIRDQRIYDPAVCVSNIDSILQGGGYQNGATRVIGF